MSEHKNDNLNQNGYIAAPLMINDERDDFKFIDFIAILLKQKLLIFIVTTLFAVAGLIIAIQLTPIYRAEAMMAHIDDGKNTGLNALASQFGGLASLAGITSASDGNVDEDVAILKSREFAYDFIKDENLMQILYADSWDSVNKKWIDPDNAPTLWDAFEKFDTIRRLEKDSNTGIFTLSIDWTDPIIAANWVNSMISRINYKLRQQAIIDAEKSIEYLKAEIGKTSVLKIKESIFNLIEAQTKTKMLASTRTEYAFRVLDKAVVPEQKINSRRKLVILGTLIGFLLGVVLALVRSYFSKNRLILSS